MVKIKFGTSGWRGLIAKDFTYDNVELVIYALGKFLEETEGREKPVIIGGDTRFLSPEFSLHSAKILQAMGFKNVRLADSFLPTPVVAFEIMRQKASGGINFTASHNPPFYNGLKFNEKTGGPALPERTNKIEALCRELQSKGFSLPELPEKVKAFDLSQDYLKRIKELIDFGRIKKSGLKIIVNLFNGAGMCYLDKLLLDAGIKIKTLKNCRDTMFGGKSPEPNLENMAEDIAILKKEKYDIAVGTDGDADRFGIIDSDGSFITPNQVIALVMYHLVKNRKMSGLGARSVMTSSFIDKVAKKFGLEVRETPVGFKYIGEILLNDDLLIGGEESGGLTIKGHVPEKDGILACLLCIELMAYEKKPLKQIIKQLYSEVGTVLSDRLNFHLSVKKMEEIKDALSEKPLSEFAGMKVKKTITIDGFKFILDDSTWVGFRLSGTEPVVRYYIETDTPAKLKALAAFGQKFLS